MGVWGGHTFPKSVCLKVNVFFSSYVWKHVRYSALIRHQPGVITVSVAHGGTATPSTTKQLFHQTEYLKELYIYIYVYIRGSLNKFPDFFRMGTFIDSTHINPRPLRSNLLRLQCTCSTIPTTFWRPHGSPFVWACQWPSSKPLSSPQLSHNDNLCT